MKRTVCDKVSDGLELLEHCIKTRELDVPSLVHLLHDIRKDAQKMEDGLKARKKVMESGGLEKSYQVSKGSVISKGVNKIKQVSEYTKTDHLFEVTLKKDGEVVYQNESLSGVMCFVESLDDIDDNGNMSGVSQQFVFGKDLAIFFGYDQLRQALEEKKIGILAALHKLVKSGQLSDPELKKKLLEAQGGKR